MERKLHSYVRHMTLDMHVSCLFILNAESEFDMTQRNYIVSYIYM